MGVSKLVLNGVTEFDISEDTVTASKLGKGITAHNSAGELITGTMEEGTDTTDATATSSDILASKTAYVNGEKVTGTVPINSTIEYIISTADRVVTIPEGYHTGQDTVQINASDQAKLISSNIKNGVTILGVTGTIQEGLDTSDATATTTDILSGKTAYVDGAKITGSLANVTQNIALSDKTEKIISKGYHDGTGIVKVSDTEAAKIVSSNIKSGVTILGVTGTVDEGVDTSDATAKAENILNGATAYVNGEKVTGTMPENSVTSTEITTANQVVTVAKGYHTGGDTISISSADQANIIASNIKKDVTILGVTGTVEEGTKINAQSKTVSPTFVAQEVTPDEDYNVLSSVTVKSIPVSEEANDYGGETLIIGEQGSSVEDILKVYIEKGTIDRLPSDLTSIRSYAFYYQTALALTSLPDKVDSIGAYAFDNCRSLALTSLPSELISIGNNAFGSCYSLALTSLPPNLKTINPYTFYDCNSMELESLSENLISIGNYAFYQCSKIILTSLPSGVTTIGSNTFYKCSNLALTSLPDGLTSIGNNAFDGCGNLALTSFPDSITSIGSAAFGSCSKMTVSSLPSKITNIGDYTFYACAGMTLTSLPSGLTNIGKFAFYNCTGLTSITFKGTPTTIASNAFDDCTNLKDVYVPWAEGSVANAPWGAIYATIHYNSTV